LRRAGVRRSAESQPNGIRNVTKETIALSLSATQCGPGIPAIRDESDQAPRDYLYSEAHHGQKAN
jgi:hypothetical protein